MRNEAHKFMPRTYQMLNGKLVAMAGHSVNHAVVAYNILRIFSSYLKGKKCRAFGELKVFLTPEDRFIPDVMIVCNKDIITKNGINGAPDLVVEVLSPGTAKYDRFYKMEVYANCGVKEYWLVDVNSRMLEIYILQDGRFILDNTYVMKEELMLDDLPEEEAAQYLYSFKTSLFDDLIINIDEVFEGIITNFS